MRKGFLGLLAAAVAAAGLTAAPASALGPNAVVTNPGCYATAMFRNDDSFVSGVGIGFTVNFFGVNYTTLAVNNNGNVTFDAGMSTYTPFPILTTGRKIIAPFFGDVDTRPLASDVTRWGGTTYGGRPAFCATWAGIGVGYYSHRVDKLNNFQLLLVDRSDIGAGDFDIVFNYDRIQWEAGQASGGVNGLGGSSARAGWSNGTTAAFELPGSAVNGGLLDTNPTTGLIHNSLNSGGQLGRYIFSVRNGIVLAPTNTPPVLTVPGNLTSEATSATGAAVTFAATATDAQDSPPPTPVCTPASGSIFPLGTTTVSCTATDSGGLSDTETFSVTVQDTTPPALTVPDGLTAEATGPDGATVAYPAATATDAVDASPDVSCVPASPALFALGVNTVTCSATDDAGNVSNGTFTVTVKDTTAPVLTLPANIVAEATGAAGAAVTYVASATDIADASPAVTCAPASGSTFALGTTTVSCTARDASGNSSAGSFTVRVRDTTAPAVSAQLVHIRGDRYRVVYSCSDAVGVVSTSAKLAGIRVVNGQIVLLEIDDDFEVEREGGLLSIEGPRWRLKLVVTCTDAAGNRGTATASLPARAGGDDDDSDDD